MKVRCVKFTLIALVLAIGVAAPASMAQQQQKEGNPPSPHVGWLYSTWIAYSLRGWNQAEIESRVSYVGEATIKAVKERLRDTVIANLETKRVRQRFLASRDSDDLNGLVTTIETELRFAGLTHDSEVRLRIRNRFGIPIGGL